MMRLFHAEVSLFCDNYAIILFNVKYVTIFFCIFVVLKKNNYNHVFKITLYINYYLYAKR